MQLLLAIGLLLIPASAISGQTIDVIFRQMVRDKIAGIEKQYGMPLTGAAPIKLQDEVDSLARRGWTPVGEAQTGLVLPNQNSGALFKALQMIVMGVITEAEVGDRLLVLAQCPACTTFTLANGYSAVSDVRAMTYIVRHDHADVVPITSAACRPDVVCMFAAQVMKWGPAIRREYASAPVVERGRVDRAQDYHAAPSNVPASPPMVESNRIVRPDPSITQPSGAPTPAPAPESKRASRADVTDAPLSVGGEHDSAQNPQGRPQQMAIAEPSPAQRIADEWQRLAARADGSGERIAAASDAATSISLLGSGIEEAPKGVVNVGALGGGPSPGSESPVGWLALIILLNLLLFATVVLLRMARVRRRNRRLRRAT